MVEEAKSLTGQIHTRWLWLMLGGILVTLAGALLATYTGFLLTPGSGPFSQFTCDRLLVRNLLTVSSIVIRSGTYLLVVGMFGAAALTPRMEGWVRAALFLGGAIIFGGGFLPFPWVFFPTSIPC